MDFEMKMPTSKEEMDALRKKLRVEISDDQMEPVTGGRKSYAGKESLAWVCSYCGKTIMVRTSQDAAKHLAEECPSNPYQ